MVDIRAGVSVDVSQQLILGMLAVISQPDQPRAISGAAACNHQADMPGKAARQSLHGLSHTALASASCPSRSLPSRTHGQVPPSTW